MDYEKKYKEMKARVLEMGRGYVKGLDYSNPRQIAEYIDPELKEECEEDEPEELYLWDGSLDEDELASDGYEIVTWPDSQMVMERNGFRDHAWLINSEEGLDLYGSSAYVVETEWFNNN